MNSTQPSINPVNIAKDALSNADNVINKFNILKSQLNEELTKTNDLINSIPSVNNNSVTNNIVVTKTKIEEYFAQLLIKKNDIDTAIITLESKKEIINSFIQEKDDSITKLSEASTKMTEKKKELNARIGTPNFKNSNNANSDALVASIEKIQIKKSSVLALNRDIKKLEVNFNNDAIEKIKKTLNTKFVQLRNDLRSKIVTFYENIVVTKSGLLNTKVEEYKNTLSNDNKISILTDINKMINEMLKYVNFCKTQVSNNKLSSKIVTLNNQSPNQTKINLLSKITILEQKLNNYKTELDGLKTRLKENFKEELEELTKKIRNATDILKTCIDTYIASLTFSQNNKNKINKHKLQEIATITENMKSQAGEMKTKLNNMLSSQSTKGSAKLQELIDKVDEVLGGPVGQNPDSNLASILNKFNTTSNKKNFRLNDAEKIILDNAVKLIVNKHSTLNSQARNIFSQEEQKILDACVAADGFGKGIKIKRKQDESSGGKIKKSISSGTGSIGVKGNLYVMLEKDPDSSKDENNNNTSFNYTDYKKDEDGVYVKKNQNSTPALRPQGNPKKPNTNIPSVTGLGITSPGLEKRRL